MQLTGHKTGSVFEGYNITSKGDLLMAAEKFDAFRHLKFAFKVADSDGIAKISADL